MDISNPLELISKIEEIDNDEKFSKLISNITNIDGESPCTWGKPQYKSIEAMFKFLNLLDNYFETNAEIFKLLKFNITGISSKAKEKGILTKLLKNYKENVTSEIVDELKKTKPASVKELISFMIENYEDIWDICKYTFDVIYPKAKFENVYKSNEYIFNSNDICNIGSPKLKKNISESDEDCDNSESDEECDKSESDNESDNSESDNESDNESNNESDNVSKSNKKNSIESEDDSCNESSSDCEDEIDHLTIANKNYVTAIKLFILTKNENISNLDESDFME